MDKRLLLLLSIILICGTSYAYDMEIVDYYGTGCPHCAKMEEIMDESVQTTFADYDVNVVKKEVYFDAANRQELINLFVRFGMDTSVRVPIILVDDRSLIVGEVSKERFEAIIFEHLQDKNVTGTYTEFSFTPFEGHGTATQLTLAVLLGAALVDSINPCTITVMVLLLGVIMMSEGKKKMALAAATFITVVFIAYMLMGIGILTAITSAGLTNLFYYIVTVAAFLLSIMEFNAYFRYKPGFFAVEMPMFLRPYTKKVIKGATSIPGVAFAALMCSLFLLPCSSGPYLMVLGMLANAVTMQALLYLVLYNIIFVLPMIAIAAIVYMGRTTVEEIGDMREKYIRQIHLFSGIILFCLFLLMLYQIVNGAG